MKKLVALLSFAALMAVAVTTSLAQDPDTKQKPKQETPKAESPSKQPPKRSNDGVLDFPDVEGWEKGSVVKYPQVQLGYSVNYDGDLGNRVSIYVYNAGRKDIGKSLEGAVKQEVERAKAEIDMIAEMGAYSDVKVIKDERSMLGGKSGKIETLRKVLTFKVRGAEQHSEIIIFPFEGNFVKLRATWPRRLGPDAEAAAAQLMGEIERFFLMYIEISEATKVAARLQ